MKKIICLGIVTVFLFPGCVEKKDKKKANNTVASAKQDTMPSRGKRLAFLNKNLLEKIERDQIKYKEFYDEFEIIPEEDFEKYHINFKTAFQIGTGNPLIQRFNPLPFSIYAMYNDFQFNLHLQSETFVETSLGVTKSFNNKVRIYPAIGVTDKVFYLVFMGEKEEITNLPSGYITTYRSSYYKVKHFSTGLIDASFQQVADGEKSSVEADIKNFQAILAGFNSPQPSGYVYDTVYSFSYSIKDYNELLGNTGAYWNLASAQTDPNSGEYIVVVPIIYDKVPNHRSFKLALVVYKKNQAGQYEQDASRGRFNHMDVCPDKCPSNPVK